MREGRARGPLELVRSDRSGVQPLDRHFAHGDCVVGQGGAGRQVALWHYGARHGVLLALLDVSDAVVQIAAGEPGGSETEHCGGAQDDCVA